MKKKAKKTKLLEFIILLIIIAAISAITFLAKDFIKNDTPQNFASLDENYSMNKIIKYQISLNDISTYNIPYRRYIDVSKSSYYVFIKATDNIVTGVSEIIDIHYFDSKKYTLEDIDRMNVLAIGESYFEVPALPEENENIQENNNEEELVDNIDEEITEEPVMEDTYEEEIETSIPEEEENNKNNIIEIPEQIVRLPNNYLDIYNLPKDIYNNDTVTNFCNGYNEIESFYTLQCNKSALAIKLTNSFNINSVSGYKLDTKKYTVTLPVKRGLKLSDFIRELESQGIKTEIVDNIS